MRDKESAARWANIDRAGDTAQYVGYLDTVSAVESVLAYKQKSYALMKIDAGHHVLDVGCGAGDDVLRLAELVGPSGQAVGIDNSKTLIDLALERALEKSLPAEFRVGDVSRLEFADGMYDSCRADRLFQHLQDSRQAMAEMKRVTRSGGWIVVSDVDWGTLVVDTPDISLSRRILDASCDRHLNGWSGRRLYGQFQQAGLIDIAVIATANTLFDYALANRLFKFDEMADALHRKGEISIRQVDNWMSSLRQADEFGQFFCSLNGYTVCGRKPL